MIHKSVKNNRLKKLGEGALLLAKVLIMIPILIGIGYLVYLDIAFKIVLINQ